MRLYYRKTTSFFFFNRMARFSVMHSVLALFLLLLLFLVLLKEKRDLVLSHVQIVLQDHRFRTYVCTHQVQRLGFAILLLLLLFVLVLYIYIYIYMHDRKGKSKKRWKRHGRDTAHISMIFVLFLLLSLLNIHATEMNRIVLLAFAQHVI